MPKLTIAQKMGALIGFVSLVVTTVFFTGFLGARSIEAANHDSLTIAKARNDEAEADMMHDGLRAVVLRAFYDSGQGKAEEKDVRGELTEFQANFKENLDKIDKADVPASVKSAVAEVRPALDKYIDSSSKMVDLAYKNLKSAKSSYPAFETVFKDLETKLSDLNEKIAKEVDKNAANTDELDNRVQMTQLFTVIIGLALCAVTLWRTAKAIKTNLAVLTGRLDSMADRCLASLTNTIDGLQSGDLTQRCTAETTAIENASTDEIGHAVTTFNRMLSLTHQAMHSLNVTLDSLSGIVREIRSNSLEVAETGSHLNQSAQSSSDAVAEIARAVEELSSAGQQSAETATSVAAGSERLAYSAEEASKAMASLDTAIQDLWEAGKRQSEANNRAKTVVEEGSLALGTTITSMELIRNQVQSSAAAVHELGTKQARIGVIVQTIDGIAEQTNLLALNAAIEAARAGEHGRGFAVVADEVRKLAEQSSIATRQIGELIAEIRSGVDESVAAMDASTSEVLRGTESSDAAKVALEAILSSIEEVETVANENLKKTEEMSANADRVTTSIHNVAGVTQEAAAAAEELSATSEEVSASAATVSNSVQDQAKAMEGLNNMAEGLSQSAKNLQSLVERFKVDDDSKPVLRRAA